MKTILACSLLLAFGVSAYASQPKTYDLILRGGTIYDGSGAKPVVGDVAIDGDRIVAVGALGTAKGKTEVDARGLAVSPGFVNMWTAARRAICARA